MYLDPRERERERERETPPSRARRARRTAALLPYLTFVFTVVLGALTPSSDQ